MRTSFRRDGTHLAVKHNIHTCKEASSIKACYVQTHAKQGESEYLFHEEEPFLEHTNVEKMQRHLPGDDQQKMVLSKRVVEYG